MEKIHSQKLYNCCRPKVIAWTCCTSDFIDSWMIKLKVVIGCCWGCVRAVHFELAIWGDPKTFSGHLDLITHLSHVLYYMLSIEEQCLTILCRLSVNKFYFFYRILLICHGLFSLIMFQLYLRLNKHRHVREKINFLTGSLIPIWTNISPVLLLDGHDKKPTSMLYYH